MAPHTQSQNKPFPRTHVQHSAGQAMVLLFQNECSTPSQLFKYKALLFQKQVTFIFSHVSRVNDIVQTTQVIQC
jgi:hypothetical protein